MEKTHIKAAVFDLDGVLVDTEPIYASISSTLFSELGISLTAEERNRLMGTSARQMWSYLADRFRLSVSVDLLVEREDEQKREQLAALADLRPIEGALDLLSMSKELGLSLGLASSSSHKVVQLLLRRLGIGARFDALACGDDVRHSKPSPDIFVKVAGMLRIAPEQCVAFEDSVNGVQSAKFAGMYCIALRNPSSGTQDLSDADLIVPDFAGHSRDAIRRAILETR